MLWFDCAALLFKLQAVHLLPIFNLGPPFLQTACVHLAATRFPNFKHIFQNMADIADDGDINLDNLVD